MRKWFRKCMASLCAATIAFSGMYIVGNESTKSCKGRRRIPVGVE